MIKDLTEYLKYYKNNAIYLEADHILDDKPKDLTIFNIIFVASCTVLHNILNQLFSSYTFNANTNARFY